ncbi:MAG TPA: mucoidy inhibitor MuiA family protein [bacterium]|nr:mucoidy inhibitor MuiA family protein [bacterium]HPN44261.1 mucoidy inhibitor MuiA family protein [bacterium]
MRKIFIVLFAMLMTTAGMAAEIITLDSRVTSATVFTSRAMVQREAHINLTAGRAQLCFSNLTPDFLDESVRISGQGTAEVKILDVKVETEYTADVQNQKINRLLAMHDSLQWENQAFVDQLAVLKTKKEFLESLKAEAPKESNQGILSGKLSIQEWQTMLGFLEKNLGDIFKEQRKVQSKQGLLANEINALERKLEETKTSSNRKYKKILVTVETLKSGRLTLQATYNVNNAGWYPMYDARVNSNDKSMQLTYYGMIRQNTGEDWKNVNLVLSTANPAVFTEIPEMSPWFLDIYRESRRNESKSMRFEAQAAPAPAMEQDSFGGGQAVTVVSEKQVLLDEARVIGGEIGAVFEIPTSNDIPGDNIDHKVTIAVLPFTSRFEYTVVSKQVNKAFLTGKVINTSDYPLLPGEVNVFFVNDFVNKSTIYFVAPTDTFRLALGVDDAIKVERKLVNRFRESKGLLGGKAKVTSEYEIIITNNKRSAETITVQDQYPISRNEKIKVELLAPDEKAVTIDLYNRIKWIVILQPGGKVTLPLKYQVEYPDGENIIGLE